MSSRDSSHEPRWCFRAALVACLMGLVVAAKLAVLHVQVHHDPNVQSFCAINESVNCDTVALSPYSIFLNVPVAVWGIVGYLMMGAVAVWAVFSSPSRSGRWYPATAALLVLAGVSVLISGLLGYIAVTQIQSLCLLCLATYVINALLLGLALFGAHKLGFAAVLERTFEWIETTGPWLGLGVPVAIVLVGSLIGAYPRYWEAPPSRAEQAEDVKSGGLPVSQVHRGVTDGQPWIGATEPTLTIVEFSDYQCPFCSRRHQELRALVEAHPACVRLVHRHFPLDAACNPTIKRPFHAYACRYAQLAACACQLGSFWEANDYLYAHGRSHRAVEARDLAGAIGLDPSALERCVEQHAERLLREDLDAGISLGIRGTPSFVVDGELHVGKIPETTLAPYLEPISSLKSSG